MMEFDTVADVTCSRFKRKREEENGQLFHEVQDHFAQAS